MKGIVSWFAGNHVAANLLMFFLIIGGIAVIAVHTMDETNNLVPRDRIPNRQKNHSLNAGRHVKRHANHAFQKSSIIAINAAGVAARAAGPVALVNNE